MAEVSIWLIRDRQKPFAFPQLRECERLYVFFGVVISKDKLGKRN